MLFRVINWSSHAILSRDQDPLFFIEKDNWDENHYKTRYHLHLSGKATDDGEPMWLGELKILRKRQHKDEETLPFTGGIDFLDYDYCSVGQSLDYYERIARLDPELRYTLLMSLRDIILYPEIQAEFEQEDGLRISLLYHFDEDNDIFLLAPAIIANSFSELPVPDLEVQFRLPGALQPVTMWFKGSEHGYGPQDEVLSNVMVITGEASSVKSIFLSHLATVAHASPESRESLTDIGVLEPATIAFTRVICVAYAPQKTFRVPGLYLHECEQLAKEIQNATGRFIYCGAHDLSAELQEALTYFTLDNDGRISEATYQATHSGEDFLKPTEVLCAEFIEAYKFIEDDREKLDLLEAAFVTLEQDESLQFISEIDFSGLNLHELELFFTSRSTEQQNTFHLVTTFLRCVVPRSLILFDNPEGAFSPTFLALIMKIIRPAVDAMQAFMIVGTEATAGLEGLPEKNFIRLEKGGEVITTSSSDAENHFASSHENSQDDTPESTEWKDPDASLPGSRSPNPVRPGDAI